MKTMGTLAVSWGAWGGFYVHRPKGRFPSRVCVGWFAVTYLPVEIDELMEAYADAPQETPYTFATGGTVLKGKRR